MTIDQDHTNLVLVSMYPQEDNLFAQLIPQSRLSFYGLHRDYCNIQDFFQYLKVIAWNGVLVLSDGIDQAYLLFVEGSIKLASSQQHNSQNYTRALEDWQKMYEKGAYLQGLSLNYDIAYILQSLAFEKTTEIPPSNFTGIALEHGGAAYYRSGQLIGALDLLTKEEGFFILQSAPQDLILVGSAGWAHHPYPLTLRGRDALSTITEVHTLFYSKYGSTGVQLLRSLSQSQTPADYARAENIPLHELERIIDDLIKNGYLRSMTG